MTIFQVILLLILLPISFGPLGHFINLASGGPDLFLIATWLFAWLTNRNRALQWAVMAGIAIDLISFQPVGYWTAQLIVMVLLIDYLRTRFFEVSSLLEAMLTLLGISLLSLSFNTLITGQFDLLNWLISLLSNLVIGLILYYILVIRFRLLAHWTGRRL